MNNDLLLGARTLAKGHLHRLHEARGRRVECLSGAVWVTQDGDGRDIVLETGEGFTVPASSDVLVSALADSRYAVLDRVTSPTGSAP